MAKITIKGNQAVLGGNSDNPAHKFISGCKGTLFVKTPFGKRPITIVKKFSKKSSKKSSKKISKKH